MKSTTQLRKQIGRKTNPLVVETLIAARKQKAWIGLAKRLAGPTRMIVTANLSSLDKHSREGDTIIVPGKVLGIGTLAKKVRIAALHFSSSAKMKLKESKSEMVSILSEIKKNPKAEGVNWYHG